MISTRVKYKVSPKLFLRLRFHLEMVHKRGRVVARQIIGMVHQLPVKGYGRLYAFDYEFVQGAPHFVDSLFTGLSRGNELGDHAIVIGRNTVTAVDMCIHLYTVPTCLLYTSP